MIRLVYVVWARYMRRNMRHAGDVPDDVHRPHVRDCTCGTSRQRHIEVGDNSDTPKRRSQTSAIKMALNLCKGRQLDTPEQQEVRYLKENRIIWNVTSKLILKEMAELPSVPGSILGKGALTYYVSSL